MGVDYSEKISGMAGEMDFKQYVEALKEERRKITVFQRELPLCLELITQAIESCTQQLSGTTTECFNGGQSECSEQTSSEGPVLEEFIPVKRALSSEFSGEEKKSLKIRKESKSSEKKKAGQSDWLKSAQLWNQAPDPDVTEDVPNKTTVVEVKRNGGAFRPFHREKISGKTNQPDGKISGKTNQPDGKTPTANASSTAETSSHSSIRRKEKDEQGNRKNRRCWSPELHRRFLRALHQLGGSNVATPKQIRELMKLDGLTNDEVKSHLQKYRLHTRRSSPPAHSSVVQPPPQYVVVGGIWVAPPDYSAAPASTVTGEVNGMYVVPASVSEASGCGVKRPQPKRLVQSNSDGRRVGQGGDGVVHSNSPATSSSTHTSTASPLL